MNVLVIGFLYYPTISSPQSRLSLAIWKEFARADPKEAAHQAPPEPQFRGTGILFRSRQDMLRLREADGAHATVPPGVLLFLVEALCVTRLHPDLLQERLPGMAMETTWLSERTDLTVYLRTMLHRISYRIEGFLLDNRSS
jgi:hypothetical protein